MLRKSMMLLLVVVAMLTSCVSRKELAYFRSVTAESAEEVNKNFESQPEPRVKVNDALVITVSALDPEAVVPYNLPYVAYATPTSSMIPTTPSFQYYTVDGNGDINFPIYFASIFNSFAIIALIFSNQACLSSL